MVLISDKNVYLEVIPTNKQGENSEVISTYTQVCLLPAVLFYKGWDCIISPRIEGYSGAFGAEWLVGTF
jgi:hypothetical protein